MKKFYLILTVCIACCANLSSQIFNIDGINYEIYVNGYYRAKVISADVGVTDIVIPDSVEYDMQKYPVTLVSDNAFQDNKEITSLSLGECMEYIGNHSFSGCTALKNIDFGKNINTLWQYAFRNCSALDSVTIPISLNSFKYAAFEGCSNLKKVIYKGTLDQWANITIQNSNLPANPLYLANNLYVGDTLVTNINGITTNKITSCAFAGATCLTGVQIIPATLTTIESQAFSGCSNITGVNYLGTLADWIQNDLGSSILSYADGKLYIQGELLESLSIPESVTKIANYAFYKLTALKGDVNIPSSVVSIGTSAFSGCTGITSVTISNETRTLSSSVFDGCTSLESAVIGDAVSQIGSYTFRNCSALEMVWIGSGVTSIGYSAFEGCSSLKIELRLPESLTSIGNYAFKACSGIYGPLHIPDAVTAISSSAFEGCSSITSLSLGENIKKIDASAFKDCSGIKGTLVLPANITDLGNYVFQGCSGIDSIDFRASVKSIPTYLFEGCSGLKGKLVIPEGITSIMSNSFSDCSGITALSLPSTLTSIGNMAFQRCSGLKALKIPDSVTTINSSAFSRCTGLEEIEFGSGVKNIYSGAFYNCESLKGIVILPEEITSIPENCFWQSYNLKGVVIGPKVTSIGRQAFSDCNLTGELSIPASVTTVGESAFSSNPNITVLNIGSGLQTAGNYSFSCSGLKMIQSEVVVPPTCTASTFAVVNKDIPVYVPVGTESEYRNATAWSDFENVVSNPVFVTSISFVCDEEPITESIRCSVNRRYNIVPHITPDNATFKSVKWEIDNTASVNLIRNNDGTVTVEPLEEGDYILTAMSIDGKEVEASLTINAVYVKATGLTLSNRELYLKAPMSEPLMTIIIPADASETNVEWNVSEPGVVTVSSGGVVEAVKSGTVTVIATLSDNPLISTECIVTVEPYKVNYYIDGELLCSQNYDYGETIQIPDIYLDEGKEFDYWETDIPLTMPANDLDIYGYSKKSASLRDILRDDSSIVSVYGLNGIVIIEKSTKKDALSTLVHGVYILKFEDGASEKIIIR